MNNKRIEVNETHLKLLLKLNKCEHLGVLKMYIERYFIAYIWVKNEHYDNMIVLAETRNFSLITLKFN